MDIGVQAVGQGLHIPQKKTLSLFLHVSNRAKLQVGAAVRGTPKPPTTQTQWRHRTTSPKRRRCRTEALRNSNVNPPPEARCKVSIERRGSCGDVGSGFAFHLPFDRRADASSCIQLQLWTELRVLSALFVNRIMSEFQHGPLHKQ